MSPIPWEKIPQIPPISRIVVGKGLPSSRFYAFTTGPDAIPDLRLPTIDSSETATFLLPENIISFEQPRPDSRFPGSPMKSYLLEKASEIVPDPLVLINLISQRVRQLNSGRSPLIPVRPSMGIADIALTEIIEGKIRLVEKAAEA